MRRLILRPGAIGDFIVSLPTLEYLAQQMEGGSPNPQGVPRPRSADYTEIWTTAANRPLVRFADRVESLAATGIDRAGLTGDPITGPLYERLAAFDQIISWYGSNRPEFRQAVAGLPFTFHTALPSEGCPCHAVDFYLDQVGAPRGATPTLPIPRRNEGWLAIHPYSGSARKNWPLANFEAVAEAVGVPVRWTAGPEEPLPQATRFDDLFDLATWLAGASVYLGNDSGISHLAAAVGIPVVALFGPTNPAIWAPRGPQVTVLRTPIDVPSVIAALAVTQLRE
ncbi:MAG: glycosyltransferase family 9 protein [Bryobacterales bacterium]|nr:glycosyltransferase family 9 protein [Bryobacterales bacterium]